MQSIVSVITPTWHRHELLLNRCIPSVETQTYPNIEHVIVSDGPDEDLTSIMLEANDTVVYDYLPEHVPGHIGNPARRRGLEIANGEYIAYLDDDDSYRPEHIFLLVVALEESGLRWAKSQMASHGIDGSSSVIGQGNASYGNIGTPMILHRNSLIEKANWGPDSEQEDWDLVNSWLQAGYMPAEVNEVTVDVWPSRFNGGRPQ